MTLLDWGIVVFCVLMAFWGYQQGLIVGALTLVGLAAGAFIGSRLLPQLLSGGSSSPYAPAMGLFGAILIGGIVAASIEEPAWRLRRRLVRGSTGALADGTGGAALIAALGLAVAWLFGAVALNLPSASGLRTAAQRSVILRGLNQVLPPASVLNTLNRIDPGLSFSGPNALVGPPDPKLARNPRVEAAGQSVVKVLGTACGLGVEGSGWVAGPGLVVTNAHVIAGELDTTVVTRSGSQLDASPVYYSPHDDLAILRATGVPPPLAIASDPKPGTPGGVLGYPLDGPFHISAARLGATQTTLSQDSYGRGPVDRELTSLRGQVMSGNSGGPMVDGDGKVLTTVFAATTSGRPGGFGVPNSIVSDALRGAKSDVGTGPCTGG